MIRRTAALFVLLAFFPLSEVPAQDSSSGAPPVVTVTATDFEFEAPDAIRSGWSTFRFSNEGEQEHFFLLWRLPEGRAFVDYRTDVAQTFEKVWNQYAAGQLSRGETTKELAAELPEWFATETVPTGGVALTEPGETTRATLRLESGTYAVECYVKTPQGTWHTMRGMLRELTVTEQATGASPPEADVELSLSNYSIEVSGTIEPGMPQTVAVHVTENPEGFVMHDINLVRLSPDAQIQELAEWMDWMDLDEFRAPAPGVSLGGVESMLAGNTGYMTVELEPGRYAWVSEGYAERGMVEEFTVGSTGQ